jgi:hypothetical protein
MRLYHTVCLLLFGSQLWAQHKKIDVLTLGTFHFAYHNLDQVKTAKKDQVDVLDAKYQQEIKDIVTQVAKFKPTYIVIEKDPKFQRRSIQPTGNTWPDNTR